MNKREIEELGDLIARCGSNLRVLDLLDTLYILCPAIRKRVESGSSSERRDKWRVEEVKKRMAEIDEHSTRICCGAVWDENYPRLFKEASEEAYEKWYDGDFD